MIVVVKLVAMLMMLAGFFILLKDNIINKMMDFIKEGSRVYIVAVVRLLVGICFLAVASSASAPWVMIVIGLLSIVSGSMVFVWKKEKCLEIINRVVGDEPEKRKRVIGVIPLLLGVIILLAI